LICSAESRPAFLLSE